MKAAMKQTLPFNLYLEFILAKHTDLTILICLKRKKHIYSSFLLYWNHYDNILSWRMRRFVSDEQYFTNLSVYDAFLKRIC